MTKAICVYGRGAGHRVRRRAWQWRPQTFFSVRLTGVATKEPAVGPHGTWPLIKTVEN